MASLQSVVNAITGIVRTQTGMKYTPTMPTEQAASWPASLVYATSGVWRMGTAAGGASEVAMRWGVHTIVAVVHVPRGDIKDDMTLLMPFGESIPNAVLAGFAIDQLDGTVVCMGDYRNRGGADEAISWELAPNDWGGVATISWIFRIMVSVEEEIDA